ncbi:MAG: UMP kinase [Sphaerochaetaceae bacterium]|nr:UMP kinase [Sphaerochaetaceae bacterium]MDD3162649.1 UMP kinase [Sphaerochaetaceae bacterium]MDD4006913.1 UMP kinase [Sphaerochaetaceae bacterium]MDD4396124.1 UMP kinase [Sphaerochaetaceae bacterium]
MESSLVVISLGGSIISPDGVDIGFLSKFYKAMKSYLEEDSERKAVLVCGGGAPARVYQNAYRAVAEAADADHADWLGIKATHLNGTLVRAIFDSFCSDPLVTDPTGDISFGKQVLVAAGWKPGFSTDTDAVYLAKRFGGKIVINLSNIKKVYTDDPRKNPEAKPLDSIDWDSFCKMVGSEWVPGKSTPFDPIASPIARDAGIKVICSDGRNVENTMNILYGRPFEGTVIG